MPQIPDSTAVRCRSCGRVGLAPVLSLGRTPLANALLREEDLTRSEPTYPLDLAFCPNCALVQITETINPEELFQDYVYFSSYSETMLAHARTLAERLCADRRLGAPSRVVEVASNDGYLLQHYVRRGVPVLGIEPARNVARAAEELGVPTLCEFFSRELAGRLATEGLRADVIHANNVLAHVPDLNGFVAGLAALLRPGGVAVVEVPHLCEMVDRCEFDTIYHEHLCSFSLTALDTLFRRHGLVVTDVERLAIHGGSLRVFATNAATTVGASVGELLEWERSWGVDRIGRYAAFGQRVERLAERLRDLLLGLKARGKRLAAYGASAKGGTLLNYLRLPPGTLDFVADRSPVKQGRYTPGTHLPIRPPSELLAARPDYVLLLTWNFADEILAQQAEYRAAGGTFIIPVPEPRLV
jgi:SAM-dependent methyltransferase